MDEHNEAQELRDILIAISVIAKRLATKLDEKHTTKETTHEQDERTLKCTG